MRLVLVLILMAAPLQALDFSSRDSFFQVTLSRGWTSLWFTGDIDEPSRVMEFSAGRGWKLSPFWDLYFTFDGHSFDIEGYGDSYSIGFASRIRYRNRRFFAEFGIGPMVNNIPVTWFEYPFKWTPQMRLGLTIVKNKDMEILAHYGLAHYSHSLISRASNKGYDTHRVGVSVVIPLPDPGALSFDRSDR
ncbi:MAG TPA: acyloxyacyl hydrolase [Thermoanaerobaculia bacterium]|nr:acyloxyacyl hydrolase [Thermoanaerobaculia bacterium]HUM30330.1 acyloxyacyl hydrolase [Thermoanaerobaculia bacterium]HXK68519.1 acyloxyacyl hydrolase [Thermoanaerobaculia bacterium]